MYENNPSAASSPRRVLLVVAVAQLMVALDMTVVNLALPEIGPALRFDAADLSWVVNAYTLAFGGLLLLGGRVGDLVGRRRTFLAATALFGVASVVGGLAPTAAVLVAARVGQGVAAAAMAPTALAILTTSFPEGPARHRALTVWTALGAAGGALGVLLGGGLTDVASWRWVLLINAPIALVAFVLGRRTLAPDRPAPGRTAHLDVVGAIVATAGTSLLVLGVVRAEALGWGAPTTVGTLAVAALLLVLFPVVEARAAAPIVRLGLLRRRGPAVANAVTALVCAGQFAALYFVSLQVQQVMGYAPAVAGLIFLPFCVGMVVGSVAAMRLVAAGGPAAPMTLGGLVAAAGLLWFAQADAGEGFLDALLGPMLVTSVGIGLAMVPATAAATAGVAEDEAGMASGILNSARQIGGAVGLGVLVAVAAGRRADELAGGAA
ncbi:MFS transporter, partial [Patulibacter sp. S7RM1-6]